MDSDELAKVAASLAGENTLLLWRAGLIPDDAVAGLALHLRQIGELFQDAGDDTSAARYGTAAAVIEKRQPR